MKVSLKQIVAASMLMAASAGAFADVSVPAGFDNSATAPAGFTPNDENDGGMVFHLFNTDDNTFSVSYYLGLSLSQVTSTEMDNDGLTLTWTIAPSSYAGANLANMQWGVLAGNNGNQNTAGSTSLLVTADTAHGSSVNLTNQSIITATTNIDNAYNGANTDDAALDVNTIANTLEDAKAQLSGNLGTDGFDWTAAANDPSATLAMYFFAQNGGRGQGGAAATATQYAGVWSFDAATGALTYAVGAVSAVPLPAALWLLLSAVGGLGAVGRRRVAA
jgi:hypothetical protein